MIMETAPDPATLVLVMKLREALKYADTELQRRCVISTKISEALAGAMHIWRRPLWYYRRKAPPHNPPIAGRRTGSQAAACSRAACYPKYCEVPSLQHGSITANARRGMRL